MGRLPEMLEQFRTGEDAGRSLGSFGVDWDAAIDYGIDVTLLVENIRASPAQRVARMDEQNRFAADIQRRTVPAAVRRALAERESQEKRRALDPES